MDVDYKLNISDENKYQNYSDFMRPSFYSTTKTNPSKKIVLTVEFNKYVENIMGRLFSEGEDLIQESICHLIDLININYNHLNQSNEFKYRKKYLPEHLINLLDDFLDPTLSLLSSLLSQTSDFDKPLIEKGIAQALAKNFDALKLDSVRVSTLSNLLTIPILLSRTTEFCNRLIDTNFFENLSSQFIENKFDDNGESINSKIASLLYKISKRNDLHPAGSKCILNMVPLLLKSDDSSIIAIGFEILSKISNQEEETLNFLDDDIIRNLISFISNETLQNDKDFLIKTIKQLSNFASLGEKVINMMNRFDCLKNISELVDFYKNEELINCILDLAKYWVIEHNNGVEMIFIFLKFINFIYIFENHKFKIKKKAIRMLKLASSVDTTKQMIDILNYDLFMVVLSQIVDNDDPKFSYNGCFLILKMIYELHDTQFCDQIRDSLLNCGICQYFESIYMSAEDDLIEIINNIMSFVRPAITE